MDTKRLFTSITLILVLFLGWNLALKAIYARHPEWAPKPIPTTPTPTPAPANPVAVAPKPTTAAVAAVPTTGATTLPVVANVVTPAPVVQQAGTVAVGADTAVTTEIGSASVKDPTYAMRITIDPHGAGIASVLLNDQFETAKQDKSYEFQAPILGFEDVTRSLATRSIRFASGEVVPLSSLIWARTAASADSATYSATINYAGNPVLLVTKTFTIPPRKSPGAGFDVAVTQTFTNKSAAPVTFAEILNGPTIPLRENERSEDRRYVSGYDNGYKDVEIVHTFVTDLAKDKPAKDLTTSDKEPLLWIGSANSYFDAIFKPDVTGTTTPAAVKIGSASAVGLPVDDGYVTAHPNNKELLEPTSLTLTTGDVTLAPGASAPFNAHAFFGPKQRQLLKDTPYYHDFPRNYDLTLIYVSKYCAFITFGWLIDALYGILYFFRHYLVFDWGLAIIALVCLVRTLLHPVTKKTQINMVRMSKMAPEMERLKKKYGDNKEEFAKAQMALYREQGVGGFLGCLPMFLQTPIWIALWNALQSTFELRQAPFLRWGSVHLTWIADLSRPDALIPFSSSFHLPLVGEISSLNLLPLLMAVVTYVQQALTPAPPNMTPEQQQQRTMMKWMSLIVPVFLYNGPSGLNLYILTSSTLGIIESKIVRDHIKKREEAEKAGLVLVDEQPVRGGRKGKAAAVATKKPGRLATWFAEQLAKAEQMKREADRRK